MESLFLLSSSDLLKLDEVKKEVGGPIYNNV